MAITGSKIDAIADFTDAGVTLAKLAFDIFKHKSLSGMFTAAGQVMKEREEHKAKTYADYLDDEVTVARLINKIPNWGKRRKLFSWLSDLKKNRKRSHIQAVLAFAQMTCGGHETDTTEFLDYLATLTSDQDRNNVLIGLGFMRPNESDYFGSWMEEIFDQTIAAVKKLWANPNKYDNVELATIHVKIAKRKMRVATTKFLNTRHKSWTQRLGLVR